MSKLACHYIPLHDRPEDKAYIRVASPYCLKLVYSSKPDVGHVRDMLALLDLPRATVILRDHALSEQKDDVKRNARETGERHAKEWDETLRKLKGETPLDQAERILVTGINECPVWEEGGPRPWVDYNAAMMDALKEGYASALNLSVGWPANLGGDTPSNWRPYDPVLERIDNDGDEHWIGLHEYWGMAHGPDFYAGWWAYRYRHLLDYRPHTPIAILECAPTHEYQNADGGWGLDAHDGWMGNLTPEAAYAQYCEYDDELAKDPSVTYATPFTLDGGHPWIEEYDINGLIPIWTRTQNHWRASASLPVPPLPETPAPPRPGAPDFPDLPSAGGQWPVPGGVITGRFGETYAGAASPHNGLDIGAASGTPVLCVWDGIVKWTDFDPDYGNYARVYHPAQRLHTFYAHMRTEALVDEGETIPAGTLIGHVGSTGNSSGPHLHFECRTGYEDSYVDMTFGYSRGRSNPEAILWALGVRPDSLGAGLRTATASGAAEEPEIPF